MTTILRRFNPRFALNRVLDKRLYNRRDHAVPSGDIRNFGPLGRSAEGVDYYNVPLFVILLPIGLTIGGIIYEVVSKEGLMGWERKKVEETSAEKQPQKRVPVLGNKPLSLPSK